ncbi:MAG TPA: ATP-grasp domain-containing protein [Pyrinomonadaceae bacterium]|nr:ATP-grasp domain-containing protein [Pyrinomonadaceae bacterium]
MEATSSPLNVVCVASHFKGEEFLRECKRLGAHVELVSRQRTAHEPWPRGAIDDAVFLPDDAGAELIVHVVSQLARPRKLHCLTALEEFDVVTAALAREHLRLPGLDSSAARRFRDKLAMREAAHQAGLRVPDFVHLLNYQEIGEYMERVPPPWVLKPRSDVSASGVRVLEDAEQVWRAVEALDAREALQDKSPYYLLERYVAGEVFHVDSVSDGGRVVFAGASRYGRPPMHVAHQGGVFTSSTVEYDSPEHEELLRFNADLLAALGLGRGAAHAEFIRGEADAELYFLEVAARVGGAYIAETLEAASGLNLWREWARVELAHARGAEYQPPEPLRDYSGIALSLARQEHPDTSAYDDPEIVHRVSKPNHVGLVVRSPSLARVHELLAQYVERFNRDFSAYVPPPERREVNL